MSKTQEKNLLNGAIVEYFLNQTGPAFILRAESGRIYGYTLSSLWIIHNTAIIPVKTIGPEEFDRASRFAVVTNEAYKNRPKPVV